MNAMNIDVLVGSILALIAIAWLVFAVLWVAVAAGDEDDE